jgi:hypothetical protein
MGRGATSLILATAFAACRPSAPLPPDLRATGLEVAQAVQTWDNAVLLVAGKRTIVRLFVTREKISHVDPPTIRATLEGFRNNASLGTLTPINPGGSFAVTGNYLRERLEDSINFELPASWTAAGSIRLRAVVDPAQTFAEANRANNVLERDPVTFLPAKTLRIRFVRFSYLRHGRRIEPTQRDVDEIVSAARRLFPVAEVDAATTYVMRNCTGNPCDTTYLDAAHPTQTPWREDVRDVTMNVRLSAEPRNLDALYFGLYAMPPDVADVTARGTTWWRDRVATLYTVAGVTEPRDAIDALGRAGPHEIGHLLGRSHVLCKGNEENPDLSYPTAGGAIGGYPTNALGLDVGDTAFDNSLTMRLVRGEAADLMTYCAPGWISPYAYEAIYRYIQTTRGVSKEGP